MKKYVIPSYTVLIVLIVAWLVVQPGARPLSADQAGGLPTLEKRVAALEATVKSQADQIAALTSRLQVVETKTAPISVAGTDFTITGKNVFIQDGSGSTDGGTGLGNLTIGYNGSRVPFGSGPDVRTGTHNLILGDLNNHSSSGGLVVGRFNAISAQYATVTAGVGNTASGFGASVSGGFDNTASGTGASVSGGLGRTAPGDDDWVAGALSQNQ